MFEGAVGQERKMQEFIFMIKIEMGKHFYTEQCNTLLIF